jgi:hypothetical protein
MQLATLSLPTMPEVVSNWFFLSGGFLTRLITTVT